MIDDNDIVPIRGNTGLARTVAEDEEWVSIVSELLAELEPTQMPERVVSATEYLLAGWPIYKVANKINTSTETIRLWMSKYPKMAAVVAAGKTVLSKWRMSKLEQQFLSAIERSQEVLEIGLDGTYLDRETGEVKEANPKVIPVVAAQARYIIGLFAGQQVNVKVEHELGQTVMKARNEALDYLAEQLSKHGNRDEEPIEATYRIIDPKLDNQGPFLDENGEAPFGKLGEVDINEDGTLCCVCGRRAIDFLKHIRTKHATTAAEYELLYMLEAGTLREKDNDNSV